MSKLYSSMYYSEKDAIARMVGVGKDTLENHLHCLSVLRNKCAHAARMYNTDFNPPAKFTSSFLRKHPEIKNNSLFAYTLVLLKRLPDESSKKSLIQTVEAVIDEYRDDIDLNLIGFQRNIWKLWKIICEKHNCYIIQVIYGGNYNGTFLFRPTRTDCVEC